MYKIQIHESILRYFDSTMSSDCRKSGEIWELECQCDYLVTISLSLRLLESKLSLVFSLYSIEFDSYRVFFFLLSGLHLLWIFETSIQLSSQDEFHYCNSKIQQFVFPAWTSKLWIVETFTQSNLVRMKLSTDSQPNDRFNCPKWFDWPLTTTINSSLFN